MRPKTCNSTSDDNPLALHLVPQYDVAGYPVKPMTAGNIGNYKKPPG